MPFGLTNAPDTFQSMMNKVLKDHINDFVVVYLGVILIFSNNDTDYEGYVRLVAEALPEPNSPPIQENVPFLSISRISRSHYCSGRCSYGPSCKVIPMFTKSKSSWTSQLLPSLYQGFSKIAAPITLTSKRPQMYMGSRATSCF